MRAVEALSIRFKDIDFDSNPPTLFVRGEYTKTKVDRFIFLTEEVTGQLKSWLDINIELEWYAIKELHGKTSSNIWKVEFFTRAIRFFIIR